MNQEILRLVWLPALAYLLGSIPTGLILTRWFSPVDIRCEGSGNIGATNVRRTAGNRLGLLTLAGDVIKGALPVYLAVRGAPAEASMMPDGLVSLVALCAFFGHLYPVYLRFRGGGKGVATAAGCFLVLSPAACMAAVGVFVAVVWCTRWVSAGSLAASAALPAAVWWLTGSFPLVAAAGLIALMVFVRHRENIRRLAAGREPRL